MMNFRDMTIEFIFYQNFIRCQSGKSPKVGTREKSKMPTTKDLEKIEKLYKDQWAPYLYCRKHSTAAEENKSGPYRKIFSSTENRGECSFPSFPAPRKKKKDGTLCE